MTSRRKYQSIQGLAESAQLIEPEESTEEQSAMGKDAAPEPKPAFLPAPMSGSVPTSEPRSEPERISLANHQAVLDLQKIATQILIRQNYKNSRTAYPICEEYLHRIRAIAILGEIPITNVINNIFALFFNADGPLNPTHMAIKSLLTDSNNMLKDYLVSNRSNHRK